MTIFTMKQNTTCTKQITFKLMCHTINHKDQDYMLFWSIIDRLSVSTYYTYIVHIKLTLIKNVWTEHIKFITTNLSA